MERTIIFILPLMLGLAAGAFGQQSAPAPPTDLIAKDYPWDGGDQIDLEWTPSADDKPGADPKVVMFYKVQQAYQSDGEYEVVEGMDTVTTEERDYKRGRIRRVVKVKDVDRGEELFFRVVAVGPSGDGVVESQPATAGPAIASRQYFDGSRLWAAIIMLVLGGSVVYWIYHARSGGKIYVRTIPGLEAVDEAVGRATEMGRSCVFIPGIQDLNDIQTIAGITILSRVAKTAAEFDAKVEVPTSRSLVMTAARETVQAAFLGAGRPEAFNEDLIYYVTDEQFGYVAYLSGMMVRDKPAACFYMGSFFAESLILAETGNSIGAIQVAGTAQPAQLPFFVAACDYTLIGEELFAASAYLSGDPEQLGSLKGQDLGKLIVAVFIIVGCSVATIAELSGSPLFDGIRTFLLETVLK